MKPTSERAHAIHMDIPTLTRRVLAGMASQAGITPTDADVASLHCVRHPYQPIHAKYRHATGRLELYCAVCGEGFAEVAVAESNPEGD